MVKSSRPARPGRSPRARAPRPRSTRVRIAGYGGAALLVAAAVAVLLMPLLDGRESGAAAGARSPAGPSAPPGSPGGAPGTGSGGPASSSTPGSQQQNGGGQPYPTGQAGGGPQIPQQNGTGGLSWCPRGSAYYRAARDGVDVAVAVASSGAIRAELALRGGAPRSQQTTVRRGGPHTFHFRGIPPELVQRVTVTTVSVGVAMQTCYARAAA